MCQKISHLSFTGSVVTAIELAVDELVTRGLTPGRDTFFLNLNLLIKLRQHILKVDNPYRNLLYEEIRQSNPEKWFRL